MQWELSAIVLVHSVVVFYEKVGKAAIDTNVNVNTICIK